LTQFLAQLKLEKVILIGNSIGGAVALQYAFSAPERVQGLILENPGGLDPMDWVKGVFTRLMTSLFSQGHSPAWWYKKGFSDYYRYLILPGHKAREQREKIIASAGEIALSLTQAWQSFAEKASDLRYVALSIRCPVLFAWASQDKIVQLGRCLPTIKEFPNRTLKLFPAAHCPHLETPEEFESAVVTFLERIKEYDPIPTHSGNPTS
jgi:4,5:9,10-diseco-3-hydroxy-5,9,17-trioxoandrosta-1(10),2-diene-4-oate hydrolase